MKTIAIVILLTSVQVFAADPSARPLSDSTGKRKYAERHRILVDLDGDGTKDLILSDGPETFGSMGGPWTIYLNRNGDFTKVGRITAHPMAISIEPDQARIQHDWETLRFARIWVYLRAGGSAGSYGYYRVGKKSVDELKSIEIYPGDGGTTLGNAIYDATFKASPIKFVVESSSTGDDGAVRWLPPNRQQFTPADCRLPTADSHQPAHTNHKLPSRTAAE